MRILSKVKHYGWTWVLFLAGLLVDAVPRKYLPDRFIAWYGHGLDTWTWDPPRGAS